MNVTNFLGHRSGLEVRSNGEKPSERPGGLLHEENPLHDKRDHGHDREPPTHRILMITELFFEYHSLLL